MILYASRDISRRSSKFRFYNKNDKIIITYLQIFYVFVQNYHLNGLTRTFRTY